MNQSLHATIVLFLLSLGACLPPSNNAMCHMDNDCAAPLQCDQGACQPPNNTEYCESRHHSICEDGHPWWYDSCDRRQDLRETCNAVACQDGRCLEPTCADATRNGDETDMDCGGPCASCLDGARCLVDHDCQSLSCVSSTCQPATCDDGIHNGNESDRDCGGSVCEKCALNLECHVNSDCDLNTCTNNTCSTSSCLDESLNGFETDTDCGGPNCPACAEGLSCTQDSDCESRECLQNSCTPFQCPEGMVRIGPSLSCIDPFEATLYDDADCMSAAFGTGEADDLPVEFPDNVASQDCQTTCRGQAVTEPSLELYACSLEGQLPSHHITWFQAKRACENQGKELCQYSSQWRSACQGDEAFSYPYGNDFVAERCNDGWLGMGESLATGSLEECRGRGFAENIFDMSGNLWEWTASCGTNTHCLQAGGGFSEIGELLSCHDGHLLVSVTHASAFAGFRCCWTP